MTPRVDLLRDDIIRIDDDGQRTQNQDLADWAREADAHGKPLPSPAKARRPNGPCRLCHERPARHICVHCHQDVCREDYWTMLGLCRQCVTRQEMERAGHDEAPAPKLDIKWVED